MVLELKSQDHVTSALKQLHWLPIRYRIKYKIAVITYKVLATYEPEYLRKLLVVRETNRKLCSNAHFLLQVPRSKLKQDGDRSFSVGAPSIWNRLPDKVKSAQTAQVFKRKPNSHFFQLAYT